VVIYDLQRADPAETASHGEDPASDEETTDGSDERRTAAR